MHGLIFETSVCYWQNQPGCYLFLYYLDIKRKAAEPYILYKRRSVQGLQFLILSYTQKVTSLIFKKFASVTCGILLQTPTDPFAHLPNHICTHTRTIRDSCFKALFGEQHFLSNRIQAQLYTMKCAQYSN